MASRPASGGAASKLSPDAQRRLAQLLIGQAQQLEERAAAVGVTAFCGKAVQRERPNERFLANTLRGVTSTNKRVTEQQMWAAWEKARPGRGGGGRESTPERGRSRSRGRSGEQSRERSSDRSRGRSRERREASGRSRSSSGGEDRRRSLAAGSPADRGSLLPSRGPPRGVAPSSSGGPSGSSGDGSSSSSDRERSPRSPERCRATGAADDEAGGGIDDDELMGWLAGSRRVRGRGEIGPRSDHEHGPYLPPPAEGEGGASERVLGPARPGWLRSDGVDGSARRPTPNTALLRGLLGARGAGERQAGGGGSGAAEALGDSSGLTDSSLDSRGRARRRRKRKHSSESRSRSKGGRSKKGKKAKEKKSKSKKSKRRRQDGD